MEDKLKRLEKITERLARRSKTVSKAIITPYPISSAVLGEDVKGTILCYMFPSDGRITSFMIDVGKKPKVDISVGIALAREEGSEARTINVTKKFVESIIGIDVKKGNKLTVYLSYNPSDDFKVTEVWVSMLWVPEAKDAYVKKFLIDELEKDSNGLLEE
jgi:hypothetical protein